jgi:hypothetical protein
VKDPSPQRIANNSISLEWLLGVILHKRNKHKHSTVTRRSEKPPDQLLNIQYLHSMDLLFASYQYDFYMKDLTYFYQIFILAQLFMSSLSSFVYFFNINLMTAILVRNMFQIHKHAKHLFIRWQNLHFCL